MSMHVLILVSVLLTLFPYYFTFYGLYVFIQVVPGDHGFGIGILTSIFHMASFKYDGKLTRDAGVFTDKSSIYLITCVKCMSGY